MSQAYKLVGDERKVGEKLQEELKQTKSLTKEKEESIRELKMEVRTKQDSFMKLQKTYQEARQTAQQAGVGVLILLMAYLFMR